MSARRLVDIVRKLRAPGGCPWDRRQTHRSIKACLIEETYEVLEAIDRGQAAELREELGDLLLQVVFHCAIEEEKGRFSFSDAARHACDKLVRRHPHVFSRARRINVRKVLRQWELQKKREKGQGKGPAGTPRALPALLRAARIQEKAARLGFEWQNLKQAMAKLEEEMGELKSAVRGRKPGARRHELGDALFALAKVARFLSIDPEDALHAANARFLRRFAKLERALRRQGKRMHEVAPSRLYSLWRKAR